MLFTEGGRQKLFLLEQHLEYRYLCVKAYQQSGLRGTLTSSLVAENINSTKNMKKIVFSLVIYFLNNNSKTDKTNHEKKNMSKHKWKMNTSNPSTPVVSTNIVVLITHVHAYELFSMYGSQCIVILACHVSLIWEQGKIYVLTTYGVSRRDRVFSRDQQITPMPVRQHTSYKCYPSSGLYSLHRVCVWNQIN